MTAFLPMYTYEPTDAADTMAPSPMNTCSPITNGKKAILKFRKSILTQTCQRSKNRRNRWINSRRAKLFERWSNHGLWADHTISSSAYNSQIASNYRSRLHNDFAIQNDVLRSAQHCFATHFVARCLQNNEIMVIFDWQKRLRRRRRTVSMYSSLS